MEDQKIINLLDNTLNQPSQFRKKKLVETNDLLNFFYLIVKLILF